MLLFYSLLVLVISTCCFISYKIGYFVRNKSKVNYTYQKYTKVQKELDRKKSGDAKVRIIIRGLKDQILELKEICQALHNLLQEEKDTNTLLTAELLINKHPLMAYKPYFKYTPVEETEANIGIDLSAPCCKDFTKVYAGV